MALIRRTAIASMLILGGIAAGVIVACAAEPVAETKEQVIPSASALATATAQDLLRLDEELARLGNAGDAQWVDRTLRETLPNFTVSWNGEPGVPIFSAAIEGRVVESRPGGSYRDSVSPDDALVRETLDFTSARANWRTLVLTVEVRNDFGRAVELPPHIDVVLWLSGSTDADAVRAGLQGQRVFAVLEEPGRLDPATAYPVARNGALIGVIRANGSLSLPALEVYEAQYLDGLTSISAIEEASSEPPVVLPLSTTNGHWVRTD